MALTILRWASRLRFSPIRLAISDANLGFGLLPEPAPAATSLRQNSCFLPIAPLISDVVARGEILMVAPILALPGHDLEPTALNQLPQDGFRHRVVFLPVLAGQVEIEPL